MKMANALIRMLGNSIELRGFSLSENGERRYSSTDDVQPMPAKGIPFVCRVFVKKNA